VDLRASRLAVAGGFLSQGLVFISLTTRLPDYQDKWDVSELQLSLLFLMLVLLAGVGSVLAERLAHSRDSAFLLRLGLALTALAVPLLMLAPVYAAFVAGFAVYGLALGVVDATTNMQAVAVEHGYGRPVLPSFHGAWTLGGIVGAALTLATSSLPLEAGVAVVLVPLVVLFLPFLPRAEAPPVTVPSDVPWRPILMVGLGMVVFYMVDTAAQAWGAVYLEETVATPDGLVALATLPYLVASLALRLGGDRLVRSYGAVRVIRVGALVACASLAVIVLAPSWPVAVLGFTCLGAGVAVVAPLSFSAAARIAGEGLDEQTRQARVDAVIGRFNQFNYVGALLGAVLTGAVGQDNLRLGFVLPMVLVLALLPLARAFAPATVAAPTPR
jgi:MFS family permease